MDPPVPTTPPEAVAAALFSNGILPGGAACRMAGMEKADWHDYLGRHQIPHPLTKEDVEQDLKNLQAWREASASDSPPSDKAQAPTGFVAKWQGSVTKLDDPSDDRLTHINEKHLR